MPWYDWDGVPQNPNIAKPVERGYCPHSNMLFAIWHRPYMLLFEQKLQEIAINIANRFPDSVKSKYQEAANKLRLPYWDWARTIPGNEPIFPDILATEKVQVINTDNSQSEIDNPLFDFKFHPHNQAEINGTGCRFPPVGGPFDNHFKICNEVTRTVRKAQTADRNVSNHVALEARFKQLHHPIRTTLYRTMSTWQPFDSFANNGRCGDPESGFGIESNHDTIHVEMAPAHMVPPAVSAFDPVFWLHHANVDRFVAIWQAVFPDTYVDQCRAETETWTIAINETLNVNSPLTPFHKNTAGDYWTPANSRDVETLGYTYPEIANKPSNETLVALIKTLYAGPDDGSPAKMKRQEDVTLNQAYLAEVQMPKRGAPYSVYVFLGDVSGSADTWFEQNSFVGLASTLGTLSEQPGVGSVDLTDVLESKIGTGEVTVDGVVDYLKANLKWRLVFVSLIYKNSKIGY
jgi:tyrosinase